MRTALAMTVALSAGLSLAQPAQAGDDKLGKVNFETSCKPEAQKLFNQGMLYQHSFWYRASQNVFEDVLKADPECGIAYWGIALSLLVESPPAPPRKISPTVPPQSPRERASAPRRSGSATIWMRSAPCMRITTRSTIAPACRPTPRRWSSWRSAIPNDDEAQIHYALALNTSASPADKTYANQLKGAAILEPISQRQPQHPGVAHYLIHLYDYPPIAEKGLDAARRYAKIAPAAAHAQHMPSHIFTRVGYWSESIASNAEAARIAKEAKDFHDQLHAMDYEVYAYLQLGQDQKAKAIVDEMATVTGLTETLLARALRAGRLSGALRDRSRRLEGRLGTSGPPQSAGASAGDHLFCPRAWRGPLGQSRRRQG